MCTLLFRNACYYVVKKLATIVEGNPKAPFSIATIPRCRGGRYSFPGLLYFTLDPYLIMLSVKQGGIKYHFLSLWYDSTWDWTQVSRAIGEHSNRLTNVQLECYYVPHTYYTTITFSDWGLVGFYGISTIFGYLMPNPVFTYIKWFVNSFGRYIFKWAWAHSFVHSEMVSSISIQHKYFYLRLIICLHTIKWFQIFLYITNNSIIQTFVYTQLNDQTALFQTTQFSASHLFSHSFNVKQFYLTHR